MTDYGTDVAAREDLDPSFALLSGRQVLIDALRWRYSTPRGGLFYDDDYGLDLRAYVNESFTEADGFALRQDIVAEALKDPRVESASAVVVFDRQARSLTVTITVTDGAGAFAVVFSVTSAAVRLLVNGVG